MFSLDKYASDIFFLPKSAFQSDNGPYHDIVRLTVDSVVTGQSRNSSQDDRGIHEAVLYILMWMVSFVIQYIHQYSIY